MTRQLRNLVFEGGGVKGVAYVGALEKLEERNILSEIERVGGTSAGAITALLVGLNYSPEKIRNKMLGLDFSHFLDSCNLPVENVTDYSSWKGLFKKEGFWGWLWVIILFSRLYRNYGLCKGVNARTWLVEIIREKTGLDDPTFKELYNSKNGDDLRKMYFIGANLSKETSEIYSLEDSEDMKVADAVRISMSFPLAFAPIERNGARVDGGIIRNYPIRLFDKLSYIDGTKDLDENTEIYKNRNHKKNISKKEDKWFINEETLGFRLDSEEEINWFTRNKKPAPNEIDNLWEFLLGFMNTILSVQQSYHRRSQDWERTAYIDTLGIKTLDFDIDESRKLDLIKSGRKGVEEWFQEYLNSNCTPRRRPLIYRNKK